MRNTVGCILIFLTLGLLACSKGGTDQPPDDGPHVVNPSDITAPVITIHTPTAGQVFNSGSTIQITGRLTDDYGLYRGSIKVVNDANNQEIKYQAYEIHGFLSYDFSLNCPVTASAATDYTVTVSFEDHGLNVATRSVKVKINP